MLIHIYLQPYINYLLSMKKRGFGVGRWSRFGGKVEKQETRWSKEKITRRMWYIHV
jgi:hypothetical protein